MDVTMTCFAYRRLAPVSFPFSGLQSVIAFRTKFKFIRYAGTFALRHAVTLCCATLSPYRGSYGVALQQGVAEKLVQVQDLRVAVEIKEGWALMCNRKV